MPRLLYLVTSAREMNLADGSPYETGYFAEEAAVPFRRFTAAGVDVVVATPDGRAPHADPYGLEPIFHIPDPDDDFLGSITRTFAPDVDDIRLTLHQLTGLDLAAARRIFIAMGEAGLAGEQARDLLTKAAHTAWRQDRRLGAVLVEDGLAGPLSREDVDRAVAAHHAACQEVADGLAAELAANPGFQQPRDLSAMTDAEIAEFDAVFVPGGHGPMVDLADNPDVRRVLQILQGKQATIATLCHGPAALLAGGGRDDGQRLFDGYRLTCFTDEEEDQTRVGKLGMPWYLDTALKNAGAIFDDAPAAWVSHVVVDRNLVTGQNPGSSDAVADAVLKSLAVL
ncbi:type 1 glutamine amidotransferase domain-containing protein [Pseudonocardia sp. H11422]|uniref:type 1 glutamine amidotransferase domain-containing protein n=1 Tax=Pseudonocardia sp. H11422 TaxID=2835866 RepID=UPI001BDD4831|nr:type 1 glutamine amidotransferase domain-containing protein [Pseudonocardia sp. H11422]